MATSIKAVYESLMGNKEEEAITFSAADEIKMRDILMGIKDGSVSPKEAKKGQSELKEKYGKEYGSNRRLIGNTIANAGKAKGGLANNKTKMMRGGMANGKQHMYSTGGNVTDNLSPGLKALNKTRPDVVKKILSK